MKNIFGLNHSDSRVSRALFLLFITACFSCGRAKTKIPDGVLTQKEMVPILVDIHIAQAATGLYHTGDTSLFSVTDYLPYILKIHHVEKAVYDSSTSFYTLHPEIMKEMYEEVINELSRKQGEVSTK